MSQQEKLLRIDIPVKLAAAKVVFSVASLSFEGDLPAAIFHMNLMVGDVADWNASSQLIAVFHTNAGHVTLHDAAYNADRNIATGNPYKELLADLAKDGVQVELCGATAKRRSSAWNQDQYRRYGANNAIGSRRLCEDIGVINVRSSVVFVSNMQDGTLPTDLASTNWNARLDTIRMAKA